MIRRTPTVLVVEDDPDNRTAMATILRSDGYDVIEMDRPHVMSGHQVAHVHLIALFGIGDRTFLTTDSSCQQLLPGCREPKR